MSRTLRRSCTACYKYKHSCDLRTPRCSRCIKRNVPCVYANQPSTAPEDSGSTIASNYSNALTSYRLPGLDPFDSYPQTRLPRERVQRLIHSCTYCFHLACTRQFDLPASPAQNCLSVLSAGLECNDQSVSYFMVAAGSGRSGFVSCLSADSVSGRRAARSEGLPGLGNPHD